jgi:hypothetical protein
LTRSYPPCTHRVDDLSRPGGWNDPCLLLGETYKGPSNQRITPVQSRSQFSMWAVMASPLLISANVRNMSAMNLETYKNKEVIAGRRLCAATTLHQARIFVCVA